MANKARIAYLKSHEEEIMNFIESRAAQKLWDGFFIEDFWDAIIQGGLSHPSFEPMRTMDEEEQVQELMDYAFGRFLLAYGQGYIDEAEKVRNA